MSAAISVTARQRTIYLSSEMFMFSIKLVSIFGQPSLGRKIPAAAGTAGFSSLNYTGKQL